MSSLRATAAAQERSVRDGLLSHALIARFAAFTSVVKKVSSFNIFLASFIAFCTALRSGKGLEAAAGMPAHTLEVHIEHL